uniref:Uncharacterized protein n=1 Tax=Candidozyma auris TaxID=498019 RepID=A0A0L0NTI9_CANAR
MSDDIHNKTKHSDNVDNGELIDDKIDAQTPVEERQAEAPAQDEDDEFGSFDEASFDEFQAEEASESYETSPKTSEPTFSSDVFQSESLLDERVQYTLDRIFKIPEYKSVPTGQGLLRNGAKEQFLLLSKIPHILPPNWTRLNIRHKLLVNLGIPINLDELEKGNVAQISHQMPHQRKKSISEQDIDWTGFEVPNVDSLKLDEEKKSQLLAQTNTLLDGIEEFNLQNTSRLYLETSSDEALEEKLTKMRENFNQLLELSALWQAQIRELKSSQEMYELVVQNMVGYSQRLERSEILESLGRKKLKRTKGKRTF